MDSEAICNPKKLSLTHWLTDSLNNIGLRDASASKKGGGSNPNSYSLTYFESIGTGTDGTFTGTDDSGTSFYGTGTGTEGTVALALMLLILAQSYHIFTDGF